jgi:hypothetical protein
MLAAIVIGVLALLLLLLICNGGGEHVHDEPRRSPTPLVDDVDQADPLEVEQHVENWRRTSAIEVDCTQCEEPGLTETGVNKLLERAKDESRWARSERSRDR